jgi:hypothetical protein
MEAFLGFALIVGLFVAYAMQQRSTRRAAEDAAAPKPAAIEAASPEVAADDARVQAVSSGSPNWGAPVLFTGFLIGAATHRDSWWGILWQVLYFAMLAVAAWSTFGPGDLREEQRRHPGTTRSDMLVRIGIPYLLIPLVGWLLVIPLNHGAAALLPAIPWILLALLGVGVAVFSRAK